MPSGKSGDRIVMDINELSNAIVALLRVGPEFQCAYYA
jgi:hypothetical protein